MKHLILIAALALVACSGEPPDMRVAEIVLSQESNSWNSGVTRIQCVETGELRWYWGYRDEWGAVGDTIAVDFNKGWGP